MAPLVTARAMVAAGALQAGSAGATAGGQGSWLPGWLATLVHWGPVALVALAAYGVVRALLRHRRYQAARVLGPQDREAVRAALALAEQHTAGEIVPVVLERSDEHPGARWLAALVALLLGSALLLDRLPWQNPPLLLLCQAALGGAGFLLATLLPDLQRLFVGEGRATGAAEEQALQEFHRQGLRGTAGATGVLLFVSLFERRVIVLGDEGIHRHVGEAQWTATAAAVLDGIARGSLRDGLIAGIQRCGAVLAEHFPVAAADRNELADRLVVRRR